MTQKNSLRGNVLLTVAQQNLLDEVDRQTRLSDQVTSRTRLRDAVPSFVFVFNEDDDAMKYRDNNSDHGVLANRERWLSNIWPKDKAISELDEDVVDDSHEDVKLFEFESECIERDQQINMDQVELSIAHKDVEVYDGDEYEFDGQNCRDEEHSTNIHHLIVLSSKSAIVLKSNFGNWCDEEFDASGYGTVYLSENSTQMLSLIRSRLREFPESALKDKNVEWELHRIFGRDYTPQEDHEQAKTRGVRP